MSGAVRAGYKQTEVGVIPADWEVQKLGMLLVEPPAYGINAPAIPYDTRHFTYLRITDISDDGRFIEESKASVKHPEASKFILNAGDLVLARTGASVGKSYLYNSADGALVFAGFLIRVRPEAEKFSATYLKFYLQSRFYWNWVTVNSMRSGQPGINGQEYASLPISIPPTKAEQEAIAAALSDADALIESLTQLIAKKRQIKQGAMQELLTGKRRLPGFATATSGYQQTEVGVIPADWEIDDVENLANITTGSKNTQDRMDDGDYPFFVRSQTVERINSYSFDGEAVLTAGDGVGTGKVFHYINGKFDAHQRVYRITNFNERVNGYFFFLYFSNRFYGRIMQMTAKSSVDSVRREMIAKMLIPLPPTKAEQEAIAEVLSEMDAELAALEAKLAKARALKLGMMHNLLTGRIRLV